MLLAFSGVRAGGCAASTAGGPPNMPYTRWALLAGQYVRAPPLTSKLCLSLHAPPSAPLLLSSRAPLSPSGTHVWPHVSRGTLGGSALASLSCVVFHVLPIQNLAEKKASSQWVVNACTCIHRSGTHWRCWALGTPLGSDGNLRPAIVLLSGRSEARPRSSSVRKLWRASASLAPCFSSHCISRLSSSPSRSHFCGCTAQEV
jgi:hypothetical protein